MSYFSNVLDIIKKLRYVLSKKQKKEAIVVCIMGVVGAFLELLGVGAIMPFMQAVTSVEVLYENKVSLQLIRLFNLNGTFKVIIFFGIIMIIIYVLKNLFLVLIGYVQSDFSTRLQMNLSIKMLDAFLEKKYEYFLNASSADLLTGCINDVSATYLVINNILGLFQDGIAIIFLAALLLYTDFFSAVASLVVTATVLFVMVFVLRPVIKKAGKKCREADNERHKQINKMSGGIKEIYVTGKYQFFRNKFVNISDKARAAILTNSFFAGVPDRTVEGICVSGIIVVICIKMYMSPEEVNTYVPKLATFAMAAFKILPSIGKIVNKINTIVFYYPGLNSLSNNMLSINKGDIDIPPMCINNAEKTQETFGTITLNNVSFRYSNSDKMILDSVDIEINSGDTVAFIGASGAGKTTLVDIILGLLEPTKGSVEIDGCELDKISFSWTDCIGYVPQNVFLMDDSVRNNIVFGEDYTDDDAIWEVLEQAQLAEFVRNLPNGLDSRVGERGINFSGGQRQRFAIARALYKKPKLLVLDEATAALDNVTEDAVMNAVEGLHGKLTIIIVAHRLNTIKRSDHIYEVKEGKVFSRKKEEIFS